MTETENTKLETAEEVTTEVKKPAKKTTKKETKPVEPTIGTVAGCDRLRVRSTPEVAENVLFEITKETKVEVILEESTNEFYKVKTATGTGFCMKQYITIA